MDSIIFNNSQIIGYNDSDILSFNTTTINDTSTYSLEIPPRLTKSTISRVCVLLSLAVFTIIGNVITIWNIHKTRITSRLTRQTAIYLLITHLAIADLLVAFFCLIGDGIWIWTVQWLAGNIACKLVKFFQLSSLYLSTFVLVLIGIDRWMSVKYPMKNFNTTKRIQRSLVFIYFLSLVLSIPQLFVFSVKRAHFVEDFYQCVTFGFYKYRWQEQLYTTFSLFAMFILPLVILIGMYISTFCVLAASQKNSQLSELIDDKNKTPLTNRQKLLHRAKMKSFRMSVMIILAFIICWTPYYVKMIIFMFLNPDRALSEELSNTIYFFGMSNSLINPIIYGLFHLMPRKQIFRKKIQSSQTKQLLIQSSYSKESTSLENKSYSQIVIPADITDNR